jgi:hypothetical protein
MALVIRGLDVTCSVDDVTTCGESDPGQREERSCEPFTQPNSRHAVLFTFGQSNSVNSGQALYEAGPGVSNFNIHDGKCYASIDPLLGANGGQGSVWGRLGDKLIASGRYDKVLVVTFGIGGTPIEDWTAGGRLHPRVEFAAAELAQVGIKPTHVLWHQGETEVGRNTSGAAYTEMFSTMIEALRSYGVDAPVYPAVATICNNQGSEKIRVAQHALPQVINNVLPGPDTDTLTDMSHRHDLCHFTAVGLGAHADLWLQALTP